MLTTFQFKGQTLLPFSQARKDVAQALGLHCFQGKPPTLMDMHLIIFVCLSSNARLVKAYREPDPFIEEAMVWIDANVTPDDYQAESQLVKDLVEKVEKARVVPRADDGIPTAEDIDPNS